MTPENIQYGDTSAPCCPYYITFDRLHAAFYNYCSFYMFSVVYIAAKYVFIALGVLAFIALVTAIILFVYFRLV